jgi:U4/U6 small nuclear ribonucleoprotein PRP3
LLADSRLQREPPPEAEWWDASLLPNKTYDDLSLGMAALNIHVDDSPITIYVQHPIPIPPPGEKNKVALKPLKLTTKEQKKMRKQRRQAELQDKRDRVRMGLIPPDAPKGVRLAPANDIHHTQDHTHSATGESHESAHVGRNPRPDQGRSACAA